MARADRPSLCCGMAWRRCSWRSARALQRPFDGLVGLFGKFGVHAPDLGELVHVAVVGSLGKAALDLDRLLQGLGRQQLLEGCRALFKGPLGVVGELGGDRLPTLVPLAQHLHGSVHVVLAQFLKFVEVEVLEHRCGSWLRVLYGRFRGSLTRSGARDLRRCEAQYMQRTMKVNEFCCNATCDTLEAFCPIPNRSVSIPVNRPVTARSVALARSAEAPCAHTASKAPKNDGAYRGDRIAKGAQALDAMAMAAQAQQPSRRGLGRMAVLALLLATCPLNPPAHADGKSAILVVDGNTGRVLHESAADEARHPASLAKMMTLYLTFERIEQGRLSYHTKIRISANAAAAAPTKLELAEGEELVLIDAIKALITKSANDLAVAIAEHIAGSEEKFAKLMTHKARQLGMAHTVFRNASGLPDDEQVTTARDMVTLALHLQDDFPQHYPLFATRTFTYGGETLHNHNTLLENFEGTDGIKTGYTRASGFNLVASVHRGRKHVVGAIFGGASAAARNAAMRTFLSLGLIKASSVKTRQPTRPTVAQAGPVPVPRRVERRGREIASAAPPPAAAPPEARQGPAIEIARVRSVLIAPRPAQPNSAVRAATPAGLDAAERVESSRATAAADGAAGHPKWTTAAAADPPMYATVSGEK